MFAVWLVFGASALSENCSRCINVTQRFLTAQGMDASALKLCRKSKYCTREDAFTASSDIVKSSLHNIVKEVLRPFDCDQGTATKEVLAALDTVYTDFTTTLKRALTQDDVKEMLKLIVDRIKRDRPSEMKGKDDLKWFLLWVAEVVLNNPTLNSEAQSLFERTFNVTVDAQ